MKVDRPRSTDRTSATRRTSRASQSARAAFARELEDAEREISGIAGAAAAGPIAAAGPVETVESLLALQEVDPAKAWRSRAQRRGHTILDHLEEVRMALLSEAMPREALEKLESLVREEQQQVEDPDLRAILEEIELRAAVELAKWSMRDQQDR